MSRISVHLINRTFKRLISTTSVKNVEKMKASVIHSYGDTLQMTDSRIPIIYNPDDVLIQVEAASVNPLDVAMTSGYGSSLISLLRRSTDSVEFPLILGRDFSGTVLRCGQNVTEDQVKIGDKVWGVVPVSLQGSHAERVIVPSCAVRRQPENLSAIEAASMMYTGVTAWCALWLYGGLSFFSIKGCRVLVLGASGGVGTMALQLLNAEKAEVIASCASDAIPLVQSLGANYAIDYQADCFNSEVLKNGPYEIILDCAGLGPNLPLQNEWKYKTYVTLTTPLLKNSDDYGVLFGLLQSSADFLKSNIQSIMSAGTIRWAFFTPSGTAIDHISNLVQKGKMRAVVEKVYNFTDIAKAYEHVKVGHARGKIVVDMTNSQSCE